MLILGLKGLINALFTSCVPVAPSVSLTGADDASMSLARELLKTLMSWFKVKVMAK